MIPRRDDPTSPADPPHDRRARAGFVLALLITAVAAGAAVYFAWPEAVSARTVVDDVVAMQTGIDAPAPATLGDARHADGAFGRRVTAAGWRPVAAASGVVHGRRAESTVWEKSGRRVVYTRLSGVPVGRPDGSGRTGRSGTLLYSLPGDLRNAVTWADEGQTAVISGADVSIGDLYDLAGGPARR